MTTICPSCGRVITPSSATNGCPACFTPQHAIRQFHTQRSADLQRNLCNFDGYQEEGHPVSTISNYISPAFVTGEMDCYRACVASILGLPVRDVPNFYIRASGTGLTEQEHSIHMRKDARKYLSSLGLGIFETYCNGEWPIERVIAWASADNPGCPIILNGKPAHSHEESHAVVLLDGAVAHDPSGAGISGPLMSSDGHSWWFLEIIAVTAARGSGNYISSVDAETVWREAQRVFVSCPFADMDAPDDMAVKVISDALDKARAEERARIVAWLQREAGKTHECYEHVLLDAADTLEQGAHDNG